MINIQIWIALIPARRTDSEKAAAKDSGCGGFATALAGAYCFFAADEHGRDDLHRVQKCACCRAFEDRAAEYAEDERRPRLIADGKRALRVRSGQLPSRVKRTRRLRAGRIAAEKPQQKRAARCGRQAQELCRRASEPRGEPCGIAKQQEQIAAHKKRKQRRQDYPPAERERASHAVRCSLRQRDEQNERRKKRKRLE